MRIFQSKLILADALELVDERSSEIRDRK